LTFKPGESGNPAGRARGSRNRITLAVEKLLGGEAEELTRTCINLAKGGDSTALRLCLDRLCPPMRDRSINFDLPKIASVDDIPAVISRAVDAVAAGEITPSEGGALCGMIAAASKAFEMAELAQRLAEVERRLNTGGEQHG
jgi:hypothetical protein